MRWVSAAIVFATTLLVGCQTVHSSQPHTLPVAMWFELGQLTDQQGRPAAPKLQETVTRVLKEAGIDATVDEHGVAVPDSQERRAREVLITDKRLAESNILVPLLIPAGSGRKTATGYDVPEVEPAEPVKVPEPKPAN